MPSLRIIATGKADYETQVSELLTVLRSGGLVASAEKTSLDVPAIVRGILAQVQREGDEAAARLTAQLDRAHITSDTIRVPESEIARAQREADPAFLALMRRVIANIRDYQEHIKLRDPEPLSRGGRKLGVRYTPIERVGVYVPGGRALYVRRSPRNEGGDQGPHRRAARGSYLHRSRPAQPHHTGR